MSVLLILDDGNTPKHVRFLSANTFILLTERNLSITEAQEAEIFRLQSGFFSNRYLKFRSQGLDFPLMTGVLYVQFSLRRGSLCY
jgi:hypothetical protein